MTQQADAVKSFRVRNAERQPTTFGWYLMQQMSEAGFPTQAALARAAGVSNSTVSRLLYEAGQPDIGTLRSFAAVLPGEERDLFAAAGYGENAAEVGAAIAAVRPPPMDPLAEEVNQVLTDARVPGEEKQAVRAAVDRILDRARRHLRRRKSA